MRDEAPQPAKAIMWVRCSVKTCNKLVRVEPVDHSDAANGETSHTYCPACEEVMWQEVHDLSSHAEHQEWLKHEVALANCEECDERDQT